MSNALRGFMTGLLLTGAIGTGIAAAQDTPAASSAQTAAEGDERAREELARKLTQVLEANFLEHQRVLMKWHFQEVTEAELQKLKSDLRTALGLPDSEDILLTVPLRMDAKTSVTVISRTNPFEVHATFSKHALDPVTNVRIKPQLSDPSVPLHSICRHVLKLQEDETMKRRPISITMSSDESGTTTVNVFDAEKMEKGVENAAVGRIVFDEKTRKILQTVRY